MNQVSIDVDEHPTLDLAAFQIQHSCDVTDATELSEWLSLDASVIEKTPFEIHSNESKYAEVKSAVRNLLRYGGYKPTGRGKPASEYLVKAVGSGKLGSINPIVDALNVVSLQSGLPISVVDLDKCQIETQLLKVRIAPEATEYVFNISGQTIKLDGLLCLFDDAGACANAVKDSQRTKTSDDTTTSLVVIWGTKELPSHSETTERWFRELVANYGIGKVNDVSVNLVP